MGRLLRAVGGLVAIALALGMGLAGALAWRLSRGPITAPALVPILERALGRADARVAVAVGGCEIAWDAREHEVDLLVRQVDVSVAGREVLRLPVASLKFSGRALFAGRLAVRTVELPAAQLRVRRSATGQLSVGLDEGGVDAMAPAAIDPRALLAPPPDGPFAELRRVEVSDGEVALLAEDGTLRGRFQSADLVLARDDGGLVFTGAGRVVGPTAAVAVPVAVTVRLSEGEPPTFRADVRSDEFALGDATSLWPAALAPGVARWMHGHVGAGRLREVHAAVGGALPFEQGITIDSVDGSFAFADVAVRPLGSAAPVTGVAGRARFDHRAWHFEIARGRSLEITIVRGTVDVRALDTPEPHVGIEATVGGPLERVLVLAGQYAPRPAGTVLDVRGRADGRLAITLPLGGTPDVRQALTADARLADVVWPRVVGTWSLTDGRFAVELARGVLAVRGPARLGGVPVALTAAVPLAGGPRRVEVTARLDGRDRAQLGLDLRPRVEGPTPVSATFTDDGRRRDVRASVDLREATIRVAPLGLEKAAGISGTFATRAVVEGGRIASLEDVALRYADTRLDGRMALGPGPAPAALDLHGTLGRAPGRARPSALSVRIAPGRTERTLTAVTDDVDLLFRALGFDADAEGGELRFDGTLAPGTDWTVDGQARARDFALARAPTLARVLAAASIRGVANLFAGRGLPVTLLAARVRHAGRVVTLEDGVLESPSLGMRFAGTVDVGRDAVDLRGSVVPSYYGLNTLAGRVPVLGHVLTGGGREGLQVFEFTVRGPLATPKVAVDPVASLAPGAVRDLWKRLPRPTLPGTRR
jgi:hypothetical protein